MRRVRAIHTAGLVAIAVLLAQCSETTSPDPPGKIAIESGDNQYSRRGTELPEPLTVRVRTAGGAIPQDATLQFSVTAGGGTLSQTSVSANSLGLASTRLTLGAATGPNEVVASVAGQSGLNVTFTATSSNFFCVEAEDSLSVCGSCPESYGRKLNLFLATSRSELHTNLSASIVELNALFGETASSFLEIVPELGTFPAIIFDAAFSARGDYYLARRTTEPEILKISTTGEVTRFAGLDRTTVDDWVEITSYPRGLLAGCDVRGPFVVGCGDMLKRFPEATYVNEANDDAVAADPRDHDDDPLGEDIYFILKSDRTLRRLPLDSLEVEQPQGLQFVTQLTRDEAQDARGMVCDGFDGNVYILVDNDTTKTIVQVTPGGTKTILFDFFSRGAGDAAGIQRDLALNQSLRFLYTLDTLNDLLGVYDMNSQRFFTFYSDSLEQAKLSNRDSNGDLMGGERVGLAVMQ